MQFYLAFISLLSLVGAAVAAPHANNLGREAATTFGLGPPLPHSSPSYTVVGKRQGGPISSVFDKRQGGPETPYTSATGHPYSAPHPTGSGAPPPPSSAVTATRSGFVPPPSLSILPISTRNVTVSA
ncbi:hypothetical protein FIBSPDRAFT_521249 [Athelia psychrophila]|uniref:Uncharacterized protein n=1 Tax=Athelia psychrophila TaxID=1759441 RepID=A0A166JTY9_9AGAM|nr:hypothetical protein FIBSPDRAFT_521249 [Fibularhizoctonia sp. CBS 109695]